MVGIRERVCRATPFTEADPWLAIANTTRVIEARKVSDEDGNLIFKSDTIQFSYHRYRPARR